MKQMMEVPLSILLVIEKNKSSWRCSCSTLLMYVGSRFQIVGHRSDLPNVNLFMWKSLKTSLGCPLFICEQNSRDRMSRIHRTIENQARIVLHNYEISTMFLIEILKIFCVPFSTWKDKTAKENCTEQTANNQRAEFMQSSLFYMPLRTFSNLHHNGA